MKNLFFLITIMLLCGGIDAQNCITTGDTDGDGLCNDIDPCPNVANPNPVDGDGDGVYNACDNCIDVSNADQTDLDGDGLGDACDPCVDPDGDGVCGSNDKCPGSDDNIDIDNDGIPDGCDNCIDVDQDDICDDVDDCISTNAGSTCDDGDPCTANDVLDKDCNCEGVFRDSDKDGVCDLDDKCPGFDDSSDFDNDGIPDGCDSSPTCTTCTPDAENKIRICHFYTGGNTATIRGTCAQVSKYFDNVGNFVEKKDHCGPCTCADAGDKDSDGDGICDKLDPCPNDAADSDGDGVCDSKDACPGSDDSLDSDDDGVPDGCDEMNYCTPDYNSTWEWISKVVLDGITYRNGQSTSLKPLNTTAKKLEKGNTYIMEVTPEHIDDIRELSTHIYADINRDGDFEDNGELIHEARSLDPTRLELDIDNWNEGTYTIRIIMHYGRIHGPCQADIDGEIEDLLIEVLGFQPCSQVTESFDYNVETAVGGASGGQGWIGSWSVNKEDATSQVSILEGSLGEDTGNKLGILNAVGSNVVMTRALNANLTGATTLSVSILLERVYGSGSVEIGLGALDFGISSSGSFYLEDQSKGQIVLNETTELFLRIELDNDGAEEIQMWINPTAPLDLADALIVNKELGAKLESLNIAINSNDNFVPSVHYIDAVKIGCDTNFEKRRTAGKKSFIGDRITIPQLEISTEIAVWPNPIVEGRTNVMMRGNKSAYKYQVSSLSGVVVSQGYMLAGLNRLQLEQLSSGIYYISVETENGLLTKKLIF